MPFGVKSMPRQNEGIPDEYAPEWEVPLEKLVTKAPRKPKYSPHDDLVEILRNCHRRFKDWRYGHLLTVCERLMTHFGIGEGE